MKEFLNEELLFGMQQELRKYANDEKLPDLSHAAECLHAALEILEEQGLRRQADQLLQVLRKIAQTKKYKPTTKLPALEVLMREGLTKHDFLEAHKGNPTALAKFNLVLRRMGFPDHEIWQMLGLKAIMPEQTAKDLLDPNRSLGKIHEWIENPTAPIEEESDFIKKWKEDPTSVSKPETLDFKSIAQKKTDWHTKGLTPKKMVENLKHHGTEFNMADFPPKKSQLTKDDMEADFAGLLDPTFDFNASDDDLMGIEIGEDSLEVSDQDVPLTDFEDERN